MKAVQKMLCLLTACALVLCGLAGCGKKEEEKKALVKMCIRDRGGRSGGRLLRASFYLQRFFGRALDRQRLLRVRAENAGVLTPVYGNIRLLCGLFCQSAGSAAQLPGANA